MIKDKCYSLVARHEDDVMEFLAKIDLVDGIKKIQTYKDKDRPSSEVRKINEQVYGYYYETITDRLKLKIC